jgi:hypothetical protein
MPRAAVLVACAVVATAVLVGGGVLALGARDEPSPPTATTDSTPFTTTPLAAYDTTGRSVVRGPFCDALDDRQVAAAIGGEPSDASSWQNGDRVDLGNGATDLAHEFGCRYAAADGTVAQAWIFAPPVDAQQAERLVKSAGKGPGCAAAVGPPFGAPTLALTCTGKDGSVHASYRGLFGDAWLVCELDRPPGASWDATDRAGRWCVAVVEAAAADGS